MADLCQMIAILLSFVKQQERSSIHHSNDLVPMTHNQFEHIQHLEAEVKLCKVYSHGNVGGLLPFCFHISLSSCLFDIRTNCKG